MNQEAKTNVENVEGINQIVCSQFFFFFFTVICTLKYQRSSRKESSEQTSTNSPCMAAYKLVMLPFVSFNVEVKLMHSPAPARLLRDRYGIGVK